MNIIFLLSYNNRAKSFRYVVFVENRQRVNGRNMFTIDHDKFTVKEVKLPSSFLHNSLPVITCNGTSNGSKLLRYLSTARRYGDDRDLISESRLRRSQLNEINVYKDN